MARQFLVLGKNSPTVFILAITIGALAVALVVLTPKMEYVFDTKGYRIPAITELLITYNRLPTPYISAFLIFLGVSPILAAHRIDAHPRAEFITKCVAAAQFVVVMAIVIFSTLAFTAPFVPIAQKLGG